ncbi:MAG: type II CRISPR RNA-guided endonuclease Cas9 [Treponema sp.]|jgi:CRISPR-associated endonuclease Csn1|nr:type II CRISPR RNA-guided endonuclease Cas9 [Treponema sp.]
MWRLALDIGTNSIGWAVLRLSQSKKSETPKVSKVIKMGVRIFPDGREAQTGTPLNEARRNARQMRRQRDRKIQRKKVMLNFLVNNKLMPENRDEQLVIARDNPYKIRAEALERKLKPYELGRIMMQFAIRRGFKSGRIKKEAENVMEKKKQQTENTAEPEGMLGGIKSLESELRGLTLGQWLNGQRVKGNPVRFQARIEKSKAIYTFYPSREMYKTEFDKIRKKQEKHFKDINWDGLSELIFTQRPLKRPERGRCQFYTGEARGYRAFASAHRFRILQEINNLRYYNDENNEEEIPPELKLKLFEELNTQKSLTFNGVRKLFGEKYTNSFNLEDRKRDKLNGNETSVEFRKPEFFGPAWDKLDLQKQDEIIEILMIEDDKNVVFDYLTPYDLTAEQKQKISDYNHTTGTTMLSSKFMIDCSEIMLKEWIPYSSAIKRMDLPKKEERELKRSLPYYGEILTAQVSGAKGKGCNGIDEEKYGRIANPTVHIALNQLRKLVNALVRRFGNPSQIILEVNRDLKLSKIRKDKIFQEQAKNQKDNERIKKELTDVVRLLKISGEDIKKYKLWEELGSGELTRRCPYCGRTISANQLMSGAVEIDHILPWSRTLLNSRDNMTVAHRECNQAKGNRTPYEAFGNSPQGFNWNLILEISSKLPNMKKRKFSSDAMVHFREEEGGFLEKQITDTAYLAVASIDYLSVICDCRAIWASPGRLTGMLRHFWGFNTLLNRGHDTWYKNRSDHRHHALDALVIGLCDRRIIAEAAKINSGRGYSEIDAPSCPLEEQNKKWRQDIEDVLKSIIVSYKPDHGKEGKLYAETALAKHSYLEEINPTDLDENDINRIVPKAIQNEIAFLVQKDGFRKTKTAIQKKYKYLRVFRDKWVTRAPLKSLSERDIRNICDVGIREKVMKYVNDHPAKSGEKLQDVLERFSREENIYSIRYFPKDQNSVRIASCRNKWYMVEDYYCVDIWRIPDKKGNYKYEGVFISRPEAMWQQLHGDDTASLQKPHPAAKLIMSLCKNDVVKLSNENVQEFCRIAGFSTTQNKIDIRPIYASDSIAAWKKDTHINLTSGFWPSDIEGHYFKSINVLFSEYEIKQVKITVDGRPLYRY